MFLTWWQMGGPQAPPTISEVAAWPAALRHDMLLLIREMGDAQGTARARKTKGKARK